MDTFAGKLRVARHLPDSLPYALVVISRAQIIFSRYPSGMFLGSLSCRQHQVSELQISRHREKLEHVDRSPVLGEAVRQHVRGVALEAGGVPYE